MRVFIQSIYGQLLLSLYICWRGYQALPPKKSWRISYLLFFIIELGIFFFGYIGKDSLPDEVMVPIFYICNTWYIASLYITMMLLCLEAVRFVHKKFNILPLFVTRNWQTTKLACFFLVLFADIAIMYRANYAVRHPKVQHLYIDIPKQAPGRDSLTVVVMSDMHFGEMIGPSFARRYVELTNAQHPDLVLLPGDMIDYESRIVEENHIEDYLLQIKAPLGVYGVNGNHEYRANYHSKQKWFAKAGITMINDSVVAPDSSFYLIGRDDFINKRRKALHSLTEELDMSKPVIVINHQPYSFAESVLNGVDLELCGHTHNGQFWPYPLVMKLLYECPYGYYRKGNTQFYVSSGTGFAGPPYRVGTVSEIVVLHIRFLSNNSKPAV